MRDANSQNQYVYYCSLLKFPLTLQASTGPIRVEVVLRGKTKGKFLEDPRAQHWETMGEVSKLSKFWRRVARRVGTDHSSSSKFLVYWTNADRYRKQGDIFDKIGKGLSNFSDSFTGLFRTRSRSRKPSSPSQDRYNGRTYR